MVGGGVWSWGGGVIGGGVLGWVGGGGGGVYGVLLVASDTGTGVYFWQLF